MELTKLKYLDEYESMMKQRTTASFIAAYDFEVDAKTVGSQFAQTFTKNVTNSFTLSFNQSLTVGMSV